MQNFWLKVQTFSVKVAVRQKLCNTEDTKNNWNLDNIKNFDHKNMPTVIKIFWYLHISLTFPSYNENSLQVLKFFMKKIHVNKIMAYAWRKVIRWCFLGSTRISFELFITYIQYLLFKKSMTETLFWHWLINYPYMGDLTYSLHIFPVYSF